jgi:hypothetical protein
VPITTVLSMLMLGEKDPLAAGLGDRPDPGRAR